MRPRATKRKQKNNKQVAFTRFMLIVAFFVLWIGAIGARLVHLQVQQHEELSKRAGNIRTDVKKTRMLRGSIYDRNGRLLAMSNTVKTLYADPTQIEDLKGTAKKIAKLFGVNEGKTLQTLTEAKESERRFVPLAKGVDNDEVHRINRELEDPTIKKASQPKTEGLYWREDQKRSYPHHSLAAHVIGFSNAEGVGQAGIEQSQNDILYGAIIRKTQERDRLGRVYDESISEQEAPKDVVLTIDIAVQYAAEEALAKAAKEAGAKNASAIVIDHKTGEVLAMANYPTFDPNRLNDINGDNLRNFSIQSMYSPGSVFKLITYSAALERKLIEPQAIIDTGGGAIMVGKRRFADGHPVGAVTYAKAMAQSSNVAAIKNSIRVGREGFYSSIIDMGFGKKTGIELPAETPGRVRHPDVWYGDSMASMSIGYEIGVSALQMATAFATIANNGVRVQPHIIKEIRQSEDQVFSTTQPEKTQVVGSETARGVTEMLREVVVSGTGKRAQLIGYSSAGKTGTAWKFDEKLKRVNAAKYISSFIGFAPAENPAVTIAVVMDEPTIGGRNGGQVSAPVFAEIANRVLPAMGIAHDMAVDPNALTAQESEEWEEIIPMEDQDGQEEEAPAAPAKALTQKTASARPLGDSDERRDGKKAPAAPPKSGKSDKKRGARPDPKARASENAASEGKAKKEKAKQKT